MAISSPATLRTSFVLVLACVTSATAAPPTDWELMKTITPQGYVSGRVDKPINVDGKLDEAAWAASPWTNDFVDIEGDRKPKPRFRTRAKMLWDENYFYIAADMLEPHVWGTLTKHDSVIFHDNDFEVFIDPNGDNHEYYEFEMNALNTGWDLFLPKPYKDAGQADNNWEIPGLKTAVHTRGTLNDPSDTDEGWSVEIAIPWKVLSEHAHGASPPNDGDQWRVNFSRVEWQHQVADGKYSKVKDTREDNWVWSPQGIIDMHRPERWGFVQFTKQPPGKVAFVPDATLTARDALMGVYHAQKVFHNANNKWAESLQALGLEAKVNGIAKPIEFQTVKDGFTATLEIPVGGKNERWQVRQDSLLRKVADRSERSEIDRALDEVPAAQREGMEFLVKHMPDRDRRNVTAKYLLEEVDLAYQAWDASPWKAQLPKEIFLNNVLPYCNINEGREIWRKQFRDQFLPLVKDAKTPSQAAAILNQKIFSQLKVKYSTQRARADQAPQESIKSGLASCTGLSILLIDACRSVGVPARFVGTPLWSDNSGNHSWVEIWDDGWHFTGAAEPSGDKLDQAWFIERASKAKRDDPEHAIYAVSFQRTPTKFPLVWDRNIDYVHAVNVTDRYVNRAPKAPEGTVLARFVVYEGGKRVAATLRIIDKSATEVLSARTNDEGFDANDHLTAYLTAGEEFHAEIKFDGKSQIKKFKVEPRDRPFDWYLNDPQAVAAVTVSAPSGAIESLSKYLMTDAGERPDVASQAFAKVALSKEEAANAQKLLWDDHVKQIKVSRADEMKAKEINSGKLKMPFSYQIFGEKPAKGRSMFISMHGGGGAPKQVNDSQWENQKRLYKLDEGVYVVPRAPTDTWNLWHQDHIDEMFSRLIENFIVFEDVDPNRVYIMGYSAGGDGVYQLAPRMADQLAAAAMMAGHPNETSPLGLRNLPFAIHVGENDNGYNRNKVAKEWETKLADLHKLDPDGYEHYVTLEAGKGHWMDRKDAVAIPWMAKHSRVALPKKIVWKQDDVVHNRFYWLAVDPKDVKDRPEIIATRDEQNFNVTSKDIGKVTIRLNDELADLDQPIKVTSGEKVLFSGNVPRTIATIAKTLKERGDPAGTFAAEVTVELPRE